MGRKKDKLHWLRRGVGRRKTNVIGLGRGGVKKDNIIN